MASVTVSNTYELSPTPEVIMKLFTTPSTADSGDTLDVSSHFTNVLFCTAWESTTTGDQVTVTDSSGTLTLDTGGATTDKVYAVLVIGNLRP